MRVHDFIDKELGKAIPYGVYDMTTNNGWVSVGDRSRHRRVRRRRRSGDGGGRWAGGSYPQATKLLVTADGGGSNGSRCRLWKVELQRLADEIGLRISVCHFPPGTSKWNKIEHRMFCHITENWRGRPLVSREVVVNLIGSTKTKAGLAIRSELDEDSYPTGREVTDEQMDGLLDQARQVPRRVELHASYRSRKWIVYFGEPPKPPVTRSVGPAGSIHFCRQTRNSAVMFGGISYGFLDDR